MRKPTLNRKYRTRRATVPPTAEDVAAQPLPDDRRNVTAGEVIRGDEVWTAGVWWRVWDAVWAPDGSDVRIIKVRAAIDGREVGSSWSLPPTEWVVIKRREAPPHA